MDHKKFWHEIENYDDEVFSVFADKDAENPIFDYLRQKPNKLVVADLGCGTGNFLPFLSQHFQKVIAVDYSETLLKKAEEKYKQLINIEYMNIDMNDLSHLHNGLDIAISVNSLLPETIGEVEKIIREFYKSIKLGGEFVGILPAADTIIHLALLEYQKLLEQGISEKRVTKEIEKIFRINRQFNILGFQRDSKKDSKQKYFFPSEIKWRFEKTGFKSVELQKVYYSWEYCKEHNYGYFPEHERIWDWFVVARKINVPPKSL